MSNNIIKSELLRQSLSSCKFIKVVPLLDAFSCNVTFQIGFRALHYRSASLTVRTLACNVYFRFDFEHYITKHRGGCIKIFHIVSSSKLRTVITVRLGAFPPPMLEFITLQFAHCNSWFFVTDVILDSEVTLQENAPATKRKLRQDIELLKLRNTERQCSEELTSIEAEVELATEQLKELKNLISLVRHQVSLVGICTASEQAKLRTHTTELDNRRRSFGEIFDKVRLLTELRKEELKRNREDEQELLKQKEKETAQRIDKLAREADAAEKEYGDIERECAVLKKRNNAIMLKMRRKLVETENVRKDLLKKKNTTQGSF